MRRWQIHTHGLDVSGGGNADDITREVAPQTCIGYNWTLLGTTA